jgi:hypothetical protein
MAQSIDPFTPNARIHFARVHGLPKMQAHGPFLLPSNPIWYHLFIDARRLIGWQKRKDCGFCYSSRMPLFGLGSMALIDCSVSEEAAV